MEIYQVVSVAPAEGKGEEALQWLTRLANYFNELYSKYVKIEIISSLDGKDRLHWVARIKSYAAFEESTKLTESDPKWKHFFEEARGLFGLTETHFYRIMT